MDHNKCDVVLEVDGTQFLCKRNQLAKESPYFEAMFSDNFVERHKNVIKIQGVDAVAMRFVLEWINGNTQMDSLCGEEILVVLQAAAMLQFKHLQSTCEEVMVQRWLSIDTCLLTAATADQLSLTTLYHKAFALSLQHFAEVRHTQAFFDLPLDALIQYLSHDALNTDDEELHVATAVSTWLEYDMPERCPQSMHALSCVRMGFISTSDIKRMFHYAYVDSCSEAQQFLKCVLFIREKKEMSTDEIQAVTTEEGDALTNVDEKGCCSSFKMISNLIKECGAESSSSMKSVSSKEEETVTLDDDSTCSPPNVTAEILLKAQENLCLKRRRLPIVPCVVGRMMNTEQIAASHKDANTQASSDSKKNKRDKSENGSPYVFYWDSNRKEPVALIPLSKVDQGSTEALGYRVVSKDQDLFVVGGGYLLGFGNWNTSVWKYNSWSGIWTIETSLELPRRHHSVVFLNDDMYIIGGFGKYRKIMDSVDRYNFLEKKWKRCASLPYSLYSAATCAHKNLIYVISSQVLCYHPVSNSWTTMTEVKMPPASCFNAAMSYGDNIYLTGPYSPDLMCFDPLGEKTIKTIGAFQSPAGEACLVGDKIYTFTEGDDSPCIEMYDLGKGDFQVLWEGSSNNEQISFKKMGGCFPLVFYESL